MIILRDYQVEAVNAIWLDLMSSQTALCVMATGSGKSAVISGLIEKAVKSKPDIKILVLFNRVILLEQLAKRFSEYHGTQNVGIYCGSSNSYDNEKQITVGSIHSLNKEHVNYNLIIIDECHNLNEEEGKYIDFLKYQMDQNPKTKVVGFTATPYRKDGGHIYGKDKFFKQLSFERGISYFINKKMLVPPIAKQPDHQIDISKLRTRLGEYMQEDIDEQTLNHAMAKDQVIDALNRAIGRKKIVWFCSSIKHAEMIFEILRSFGEFATTIHSKLADFEQEINKHDFENGNMRHLTFVSMVSEGYDYPPIDCVVLMRPTKSPVMMVQTCGRGLRPFEDKENCLILDYANVISSLGPLEDPVVIKKGKSKGKFEQSQKVCPECRTYLPPRTMKCHVCGFEYPKIDAAKNNMTADEEAEFLSKKPIKFDVGGIEIDSHLSKNGNKCIKISYWPSFALLGSPIVEFFSIASDYGMKRFCVRAIELGIDLRSEYEEQCRQKAKRIPQYIEYFIEDKYPRIKRMVFNDSLSNSKN